MIITVIANLKINLTKKVDNSIFVCYNDVNLEG